MRERGKQATPWVGLICRDEPLKFKNTRPKDAKTGNLVLLDVRNAGNDKDVLVGDWEASYQFGIVARRELQDPDNSAGKPKDYLLHLIMWEPYYKSEADGKYRPLWVENAIRAKKGLDLLPTTWQAVVRLPWCPVKQIPLEHSRKLLGIPNFKPSKGGLVSNFMDSGVDCHKQPKGYRHSELASTVRHVFQFEKAERNKNLINFTVDSQRDILLEISRTEGHDDAEHFYAQE